MILSEEAVCSFWPTLAKVPTEHTTTMGRVVIFLESEDAAPDRKRSSECSPLARAAHHDSSQPTKCLVPLGH